MQMKGMVRVFAALMIIFSLYQLSFSWFVKSHESEMQERAERQVKAKMPAANVKYPNDKALQLVYQDSLNLAIKTRYQRLIDSTSKKKISWWGLNYKDAKEEETKLGLDLQGGMNVTLEVGMDDLVRSLSGYSRDKVFNEALTEAIQKKATSGTDLIDLFVTTYQAKAPDAKLAPLFAATSNKRINLSSSDDQVIKYIRAESELAFQNTFNILRNRIDRFGVASPNINPDNTKKIITVELAGVTDRERVRKYLQSSANLQFFELYNTGEIYESLNRGEKLLASILKGVAPADTAAKPAQLDSTGAAAVVDTTKKDSATAADFPIQRLMQVAQPRQGENGQQAFPAEIGYVAVNDTAVVGEYLRHPVVASQFPSNLRFAFGDAGGSGDDDKSFFAVYALKTIDGQRAKLEGDRITDASQDYDERGRVAIGMNMDNMGAKIWAKMTGDNIGKGIAIVLDNFVYSAPNVNSVIPNGRSEISGSYEVKEAQDLAKMLKSGKLPAPAKIVAEQVVGPTLGAEAIKGGTLAFVISFAVIFVLMLLYYNSSGWIANISLILNILFTVSILIAMDATFTAASIAGLVLTIGMAVDTNVIIFERIKDELGWGSNYQTAVSRGYQRSLPPVLDAHITTFLTAVILYYFGLGPIRGFAYVQMWGIALNLFCGILISRTITDWFTNRNKNLEYFTKASRRIFRHAQYKFIEFRKVAYGISVVVLLLGVASLFYGFDKGVEFSGGRSYTVDFKKPIDIKEVRNDLQKSFGENPIIKTIGSPNQLDITTSFMIDAPGLQVDSIVESTLYAGLNKFLPPGTSFIDFEKNFKMASQKVLPTISVDLRNGAILATIFSLIVIVAYIFIRFRDWRYSLGTIVALMHDVLVTLIVFSFLRNIVPFPLEIDQHFIAAILTVIGFSMNDTIIIFDRIRENSRAMKGVDRSIVVNKSVNDTLSRTIMTNLTVFITISILFIVGGEVTRGFAFAMLIGVVTGTYSSIFVAAPILVDIGKNRPLGEAEPEVPTTKKVLA